MLTIAARSLVLVALSTNLGMKILFMRLSVQQLTLIRLRILYSGRL